MKILICGLPGSGKTTLAEPLAELLGAVWINADQVRKKYDDWDFTPEGRIRQAQRMRHLSDGAVMAGKVVVTDFVSYNGHNDENDLRNYHTNNVIKRIDDFLNVGNEDKSLYSAITSYKTYLQNFDYSTMTFPMTKTWEEYCEDNLITYVSPLQIP